MRYKQTVLGAPWAILQPFFTMVVFTLFFGRLAASRRRAAVPVFAFAGLVPWTLFAKSLNGHRAQPGASRDLLKKIYFPRLLLPVAAVGSVPVDFVLALVVLLADDRSTSASSPGRRCLGPPCRAGRGHSLGVGLCWRRSTSSIATSSTWCPSWCRSGCSPPGCLPERLVPEVAAAVPPEPDG